MARLNACGVQADALPRRGLTLRVQADAVPPLRPVWEESRATAASLIVCFPHPRIAAQLRAPLHVCGGGSRGYWRARDITRCWPQASCLPQARRAASMPRTHAAPVQPALCQRPPARPCASSACCSCSTVSGVLHSLRSSARHPWLASPARCCTRAPARLPGAVRRSWRTGFMRPCGS